MKDYIHREIEGAVQEALGQFPVVLVTGPRQAGKSTLVEHLLQGYQYVSFDDVLIRNLAQTDPALFLETYKPPLILDEIQYVPSLLSNIKLLVDKDRRKYGQYVITGSQVFSLMQGVSESLAGRVMIFQLFPMSWQEIKQTNPLEIGETTAQMLQGFYPEFQVQQDLKAKFWHSSYLSTYIERDLRALRNIHDLGLFQRYLVLLAARAGQLLNLSEVSKECGITQSTAKDWLTLLQATSIVYLLEPYARNMTKRVVKTPKLYFVDTGLLCYLLRLESAEQLMHSPFVGHIFENMVILEQVKKFANRGQRAPFYFYRTSGGVEVDLLIDHGDTFDAYEIKYSASPSKQMVKSLTTFCSEFPVKNVALLNLKKESLPLTANISAQHWSTI